MAWKTDLLERFYREAKAAGGLQHPNIVTVYEMSESDGFPFIAMEYLEGESLEKLIARPPPPPCRKNSATSCKPAAPSIIPTAAAWCIAISSPPTLFSLSKA